MAEWRFGRGWSERELERRICRLRGLNRNFPGDPERADSDDPANPWRRYYSEAVIAREAPGAPEPGGAFERAKMLVARYQFSDPGIVTAHFLPHAALLKRHMLLEIRVANLHYLCGTEVGAVRDEDGVFGFRYDTLEGHFEQGTEWFLLSKRLESGDVRFRIQAAWRPGHFPNWWSKLGFRLVGERYQRAWHRLAYLRLRAMLGSEHSLEPLPAGRHLFHTGPETVSKDAPAALRVGSPLARAAFIGHRGSHRGIRERETRRRSG